MPQVIADTSIRETLERKVVLCCASKAGTTKANNLSSLYPPSSQSEVTKRRRC